MKAPETERKKKMQLIKNQAERIVRNLAESW